MAVLPDPIHLGLPPKFKHWQNGQDCAVVQALDSPKRFVVQNAPTGFGKTVMYMAQALLSGARTAFLTSSKGLQTQLIQDFGEIGLFDIRGANNYPCRELTEKSRYRASWLRPGMGCDAGPCHAGEWCDLRMDGCHYYDAVRQALASRLVTTNYAYWLASHLYTGGLGEFDLLVLDEAHKAPDELGAALQTELFEPDLQALLVSRFPEGGEIDQWVEWAEKELHKAEDRLADVELEIQEARTAQDSREGQLTFHKLLKEIFGLRAAIRRLTVVAKIEGHWVIERKGRNAKVAPVSPAAYAEQHLFLGIPKVVLVSATIQKKTLEMLGVTDFDFFEYPSSFPVERRPVIHVQSGVRCRHSWDEVEQKTWVRRIDQIIDRRLDRKGIVHTVSYERRDLVLKYSDHKDVMLINYGHNTQWVVDDFKKADPPAVLVSPSLTTGWDLPFEDCEYAILGKVPFPDTRSAIIKARNAEDPSYGAYQAMLAIVQSAGRGMRSADDQCEILIVDDMFEWFWRRYQQFAPRWFRDAVRRAVTIPEPLPKLKQKERLHG